LPVIEDVSHGFNSLADPFFSGLFVMARRLVVTFVLLCQLSKSCAIPYDLTYGFTKFARSIVLTTRSSDGWNRTLCFVEAQILLESNNPEDVALVNASFVSRDLQNPSFRAEFCPAICGPSGTGVYPDIGPRLLQWLLPIVLLTGNLYLDDIGRRKYLTIPYALGNPIMLTYRLLSKLDKWDASLSVANKEKSQRADAVKLGRILAFRRTCDLPGVLFCVRQAHTVVDAELTAISTELGKHRESDFTRTGAAVLLYVMGVVAAFTPALSDGSDPSGGKLGPAIQLSWLLPVAVLSNAVGGFTDPAYCAQVVGDSMSRITLNVMDDLKKVPCQWQKTLEDCEGRAAIFQRSRQRQCLMLFLASLPVFIAFAMAMRILDSAPVFFNIRNDVLIGIFFQWILSACLALSKPDWLLISNEIWVKFFICKDMVVAACTQSLIFASTSRLGTSCEEWGGQSGIVQLNPVSSFNENNGLVYPATIAVGFTLQILTVIILLWLGRGGLRMMRWRKSEKETWSIAVAVG
jgi:hypothetical protein